MLAHQYSICLTIALGRLPWCPRVSLRARRLSASSPRPRSCHHNLPTRTCVPPSSPTCPPLACIYARPLGLFWLGFSNSAEDHLHLRARHLHHPAGGICAPPFACPKSAHCTLRLSSFFSLSVSWFLMVCAKARAMKEVNSSQMDTINAISGTDLP
jgi:hypothetical protein